MEIMTIEFGGCFERAWTDHDAVLWDGTEKMNSDATFFGHADIIGKNVTIGDCIERVKFDEDDVLPVDPWPMLRMVA